MMSAEAKPGLRISAVVPLFNGSRYIEEALISVLKQTLPPDDIIVVDDGSVDEGPSIIARMAKNHPITLVEGTNWRSICGAEFWRPARHRRPYCIPGSELNSWLQCHLEVLVSPFLKERPHSLGWTYSDIDEIDATGGLTSMSLLRKASVPHPKTNIMECLRQDMMVPLSASLISREAWDSIGGMDERLYCYEADDLFIRLLHAGYGNIFISEAVSRVRVLGKQGLERRRVAESRMIYGRKLMESFSAGPAGKPSLTRDAIASRFVQIASREAKKALQTRDDAWVVSCLHNLRFFEAFLQPASGSLLLHREPLVTTIIPLLNGADFIEAAIRCVLSQTLTPDEIIVVDVGSTDRGPEIVEDLTEVFPIRLIRRQITSEAAACSAAVEQAHGDLLAFLNQEDLWCPTHLAELVASFRLKNAHDIGLSYSDIDEITPAGQMVRRQVLAHVRLAPDRNRLPSTLRDTLVPLSAIVISRTAFQAVGGFDEPISDDEEDNFFLRLRCTGFHNVFHPGLSLKSRSLRPSRRFWRQVELYLPE